MSRAAARSAVTSSPSSRMRPAVGNSSTAIIGSVVVLPQPDGPSMTKKVPSSILSVTSFTAAKDPNVFDTVSSLISAMRLFRKMADDHEAQRPSEDRDERVAVEVEGPVGSVVGERELYGPQQREDIDGEQQQHRRGNEQPRNRPIGKVAKSPCLRSRRLGRDALEHRADLRGIVHGPGSLDRNADPLVARQGIARFW